MKDAKGDAAAGIRTLPVILGMSMAQRVTAVFFLISYGFAAWHMPHVPMQSVTVALGLAAAWWLVRPVYRERPVFLIYLCSLLGLILYLVFQ